MRENEQLKSGFTLVWGILVLITFIVCAPILPKAVNAEKQSIDDHRAESTYTAEETTRPEETDESAHGQPEESAALQNPTAVIPCRAGGESFLSMDSIIRLTAGSDMPAVLYSFDKENSVLILGERAFYTEDILRIGNELFLAEEFAVSLFSLVYDESEGGYINGCMPNVKEDFYNSEDLRWLSAVISSEARGESFLGKIAVGNVVLNRVRSPLFPNTVKDVVFDTAGGVQFSPVKSGSIYNEPTEESVLAAKVCLEGGSIDDTILFFYNPVISSSTYFYEKRTYIMTVGNHDFFS